MANGIGTKTVEAIETVGDAEHKSFAGAVELVATDSTRVPRGRLVKAEFDLTNGRLAVVAGAGTLEVEENIDAFYAALPPSAELDAARGELVGLARSYASVTDLP